MKNKKYCRKCRLNKSVSKYSVSQARKDGLQLYCKDCCKKYYQKNKKYCNMVSKKYYYQNRKKRLLQIKKYEENNQEKVKLKRKKWYRKNKIRHNELMKSWHNRNKKKHKNLMKNWYKNNKKKIIAKNKKRREKDPLYRAICNLRSRTRAVLKGYNKSKNTLEILGCSMNKFWDHLESKFTEGMNRNNYGLTGWHIDHIIPLSSARNKKELEKLLHYTNCQPLWAKDNLSKGDKY